MVPETYTELAAISGTIQVNMRGSHELLMLE